MRSAALSNHLRAIDRAGIWCMPAQSLRLAFPEPEATFYRALKIHEKNGLIRQLAHGVWYNPEARSIPEEAACHAVSWLRPLSFNVLSLETVLSECGAISQMPSALTLVTDGPSHRFDTALGTIEFVHSSALKATDDDNYHFDERRQLWVASPEQAYRDLKRSGRNLNLVDVAELAALH